MLEKIKNRLNFSNYEKNLSYIKATNHKCFVIKNELQMSRWKNTKICIYVNKKKARTSLKFHVNKINFFLTFGK